MNFAKKLKIRMAELDMKGTELAKITGFHATSISRWRNGKGVPDINDIMKLAKALECEAAALLPDPEEDEEEQAA